MRSSVGIFGNCKRIAKNFAILFFLLCKTHDLTGLSIVCYTFEIFHKKYQLDKLEFVVNYSNLIFPVFVFISHLPPIASPIGVLGISILPVLVRAINTILDDSLPQTLPVLVFTKISGAEQSFNKTFPVPRWTQMLSVAVNLFNEMHPVFPFE